MTFNNNWDYDEETTFIGGVLLQEPGKVPPAVNLLDFPTPSKGFYTVKIRPFIAATDPLHYP